MCDFAAELPHLNDNLSGYGIWFYGGQSHPLTQEELALRVPKLYVCTNFSLWPVLSMHNQSRYSYQMQDCRRFLGNGSVFFVCAIPPHTYGHTPIMQIYETSHIIMRTVYDLEPLKLVG